MARIYWLLGSATDREAGAAIALSHELPETWSIICNKMLWTPYARRFELDMVVVGEHGVYVIDEKSWRSPVKCGAEWWTISNGRAVRSPLNKIENAAAVLGTSLRDDVPGLRPSVRDGMMAHAFVLFSRRGIDLDLDQCPAPDRVLRMEQAAVLLKSFDDYRGSKGADLAAHRDQIVRWVLGTDAPVPVPEPGVPVGDDERREDSDKATAVSASGQPPIRAARRRGRRSLLVGVAAAVIAAAVIAVVLLVSQDGSGPEGAAASPTPSLQTVVWSDAHAHVGEHATVEGVVMDVERSPMGAETASTFINIGEEFRSGMPADPSRFYAVVPEEYDARFRSEVVGLPGGPSSPGEAYVGATVQVTGRIDENSRGEPFIEVHSTASIAVVD